MNEHPSRYISGVLIADVAVGFFSLNHLVNIATRPVMPTGAIVELKDMDDTPEALWNSPGKSKFVRTPGVTDPCNAKELALLKAQAVIEPHANSDIRGTIYRRFRYSRPSLLGEAVAVDSVFYPFAREVVDKNFPLSVEIRSASGTFRQIDTEITVAMKWKGMRAGDPGLIGNIFHTARQKGNWGTKIALLGFAFAVADGLVRLSNYPHSLRGLLEGALELLVEDNKGLRLPGHWG